MLRGFSPNKDAKVAISGRITLLSKETLEIVAEAINASFAEYDIISNKITVTDVLEEILANSIENNDKILQIDDNFYSLKEIVTPYLENKFCNDQIKSFISKEELMDMLYDIGKEYILNKLSIGSNEYRHRANNYSNLSLNSLYIKLKSAYSEQNTKNNYSDFDKIFHSDIKKHIFIFISQTKAFKGINVFKNICDQSKINLVDNIIKSLNYIVENFINLIIIDDRGQDDFYYFLNEIYPNVNTAYVDDTPMW